MPQDKGRWRVAPAPDGRGMPDEHKPRPPHRWRGFWIFLGALLAINFVSVLMAQSSGQPRVKVPFSPYFLRQVQAGQTLAPRKRHTFKAPVAGPISSGFGANGQSMSQRSNPRGPDPTRFCSASSVEPGGMK